MPTIKGKIESMTIQETISCVSVKKTDGTDSTVLLWSYPTQEDNAKNRLTHGMYLSLSRDAFIHCKTIEYVIPSGSSIVTSVKISS